MAKQASGTPHWACPGGTAILGYGPPCKGENRRRTSSCGEVGLEKLETTALNSWPQLPQAIRGKQEYVASRKLSEGNPNPPNPRSRASSKVEIVAGKHHEIHIRPRTSSPCLPESKTGQLTLSCQAQCILGEHSQVRYQTQTQVHRLLLHARPLWSKAWEMLLMEHLEYIISVATNRKEMTGLCVVHNGQHTPHPGSNQSISAGRSFSSSLNICM